MYTTFAAVFPIFALLILGNLARRSHFLDEKFWPQAEKATYYVLLPALLISRLAQAEFDWGTQFGFILAAMLLPTVIGFLCFFSQTILQLKNPDFTSFFQGGIRFNTYIGLPLVAILPGDGLTLAALLLAMMVPVINVLCVLVYEIYADRSNIHWHKIVSGIVKNPLIIACVIGISMNLTQLIPPEIFMSVLDKLAIMALPMGLLAVGAGLRLKALRTASQAFIWSTGLKLIAAPLITFGITLLFGIEGLPQAVLIIYSALPTASSSYILARQMGGNAELMAGIITGQTLLSMLSLPIVLMLLEG